MTPGVPRLSGVAPAEWGAGLSFCALEPNLSLMDGLAGAADIFSLSVGWCGSSTAAFASARRALKTLYILISSLLRVLKMSRPYFKVMSQQIHVAVIFIVFPSIAPDTADFLFERVPALKV